MAVIMIAIACCFQCLNDNHPIAVDTGFQWDVNWGQAQGIVAFTEHSMSIWDTATVTVSLDLDDVHLVDMQVSWNSEYFYLISNNTVTVSPVPFDIVLHKTNNVDFVAYGAVCKEGNVIDVDQNLLVVKIRAKKLGTTPIILTRSVAYSGYNEATNYLYQKSALITNDTCYVTIIPK